MKLFHSIKKTIIIYPSFFASSFNYKLLTLFQISPHNCFTPARKEKPYLNDEPPTLFAWDVACVRERSSLNYFLLLVLPQLEQFYPTPGLNRLGGLDGGDCYFDAWGGWRRDSVSGERARVCRFIGDSMYGEGQSLAPITSNRLQLKIRSYIFQCWSWDFRACLWSELLWTISTNRLAMEARARGKLPCLSTEARARIFAEIVPVVRGGPLSVML